MTSQTTSDYLVKQAVIFENLHHLIEAGDWTDARQAISDYQVSDLMNPVPGFIIKGFNVRYKAISAAVYGNESKL